jgi:D-sedoheptulose 7-phosphate isomerase
MQRDEIVAYINEGIQARSQIDSDLVYSIGMKIAERIKKGGKLVLFGNGGSAADSQHIAAELVGRFEKERRPLPAMALHTNTSSLTAIANDYSYDAVYSRQVEAFCSHGDAVIGLSTSGNSPNVVKGLEAAKKLGCITVALTGASGGKSGEIADYTIKIASKRTSIIQECHIAIGHIISKIIEDFVFA